MAKSWKSLGEVLVKPDGSNLRVIAEHPVIEYEETTGLNGLPLFTVLFQRMVTVVENYTTPEPHSTRCQRRAVMPVEEIIETDNSVTALHLLQGAVLRERKPYGRSRLDHYACVAAGASRVLTPAGQSDEALQIAQQAALGFTYNIVETYRPITDANGNFTVNPVPVSVAKTA